MYNKNKLLLGILALLLAFGSAAGGEAAAAKADKPAAQTQANLPIVIEADKLYFSDLTGDLYAQGNVQVTQGEDKLLAALVQGNTKQGEVWVDGQATFLQPGTELIGRKSRYNYQQHTGSILKASGIIGKDRVKAENINILPDRYILNDSTVTRCPAVVPDYHISARKIEIWPGEKMIVYDAKFWIKDKVIFSLPKYQKSLVNKETTTEFPRVGYSSENGFSIAQYLETPVLGEVAAFADLAYYSKRGFEPTYGLVTRQSGYTLQMTYGSEDNADHEWVDKEPDFALKFKPYRLGNTSLTANFSASAGKWSEGAVTGTRRSYNFYLANDPIKLSDTLVLTLGGGYEKVFYGYNDTTNNIWRYDLKLTAKPNNRLEAWTGYSYNNQSSISPYQYDRIDTPRELYGGFMYRIDRMNGFGLKLSYDVDVDRVKDLDYTWRRNLHCWEADITYRAKRDQFNIKVSAVQW
ncbi:LptA/OstA family protein [Sporolituus thermophilus]|uniref:LPS-assembly protein n=1 Tax=Sporolituus thermophilus DSM 23256 TaxID=1123285 RepID=A0A1G7NHF9_9FIRM|nr:LptA/OstA family protein [Sporolituus thermophilus]SDF72739.1 LPS-assembly protein [Sporolituus thermophilus DSM 23256]